MHAQLPREKLLAALERALVDVTNGVGVDINRAVIDAYYQHLLPFVCGLGPRKAQALARKIASIVCVQHMYNHLPQCLILVLGRQPYQSRPVHQEQSSDHENFLKRSRLPANCYRCR